MSDRPSIVVVGGINMDITGSIDTHVIMGDSNPGKVTMTPGGVGRNIAENIARLGVPVSLLTALGDDAHTTEIRRHCASVGIDLSYSGVILGVPSGTYLCINNPQGDCLCAVADMAVCDHITPEYLSARMHMLQSARMMIVDTNIPEASLHFLCHEVHVPIFADPVSCKKAPKLLDSLPYLYAVKPNRQEAALLSGVDTETEEGVRKAADQLLQIGVKHVFITLGKDGVYYADQTSQGIQPCLTTEIVSTNGCGDAFLASAAVALMQGKSTPEAAKLGQAASAVCASSAAAVSVDLRMESMENYY